MYVNEASYDMNHLSGWQLQILRQHLNLKIYPTCQKILLSLLSKYFQTLTSSPHNNCHCSGLNQHHIAISFLTVLSFSNPAPYSLFLTKHSEECFLKPKSDSATSLLETL